MLDVWARDGLMCFAKQLGLILLVGGLTGCAGVGVKPDGDADAKSVVAKRAQSRWGALIKGDLAAAYEYLSPGTRSVLSLEEYGARIRTMRWKKTSVDSVVCERDRCDVAIMLEYSYRDIKSIETRQIETWLHEGGNWWYVPRK
jgi:hypothetical protein